ncbi:tyrosine-type recombinase/integrase [Streptomyces sp. Ru62]|uniref:tyrosine-type recombinase/integrase n=1 Tax=Streptomyces sp. Ru62 TaxID=2080745 RepID=UPI0027E45AD1|nr:tyrosine-type recombinase/integrase [Streptomyces sp. Ru62]
MGEGFRYGDMEPADVELMMQTAYLVLRDTGRRPVEIASLRLECVKTRGVEDTLIWDNVKKRRYGRKLPITRETAAVIRTWQSRRHQLEVPSRSQKYQFPSITGRSGIAHVGSNLANAMRDWVAAIPVLLSDELDEHGNRLPFDRSLSFLYAFRHAYAQRYADAGVPVDVLKELMDHRSIVTTMSYYQVSLKREREAITTMRQHTIDRSGRPAPFTSTADYAAQSVAVPFGNCREPSNAKAGGKACVIRFQCAGCGFFAPTRPTCPRSTSTSTTCGPTARPPRPWTPTTSSSATSPTRSPPSRPSPTPCATGSASFPRTSARRSRRPARSCGRSARPGTTSCCR